MLSLKQAAAIRANGTGPDETKIETFKNSLRGQLIRPGDPAYDEARRVWNGMIDKRPALIARVAGVADIIEAVNFARENNLHQPVSSEPEHQAGKTVTRLSGLKIKLANEGGQS